MRGYSLGWADGYDRAFGFLRVAVTDAKLKANERVTEVIEALKREHEEKLKEQDEAFKLQVSELTEAHLARIEAVEKAAKDKEDQAAKRAMPMAKCAASLAPQHKRRKI